MHFSHAANRLLWAWVLALPWILLGCTVAPEKTDHAFSAGPASWFGRISIVNPQAQPVRFSASFELSGSKLAGSMHLSTSLGTSLARVVWSPDAARVETPGSVSGYPSLHGLLAAHFGMAFPIDQVFAWLNGQTPALEGWLIEIEEPPVRRLIARSTHHPGVEIRILVDQP